MPTPSQFVPLLILAATQGVAADPHDLILRSLRSASDEPLVQTARAHPADARDALADLFAAAVDATPDEQARRLADAERLAGAFWRAWSDSFLIRRVAQFRRWSPAERARKTVADSLQRAGRTAFLAEGPDSATFLWNRALAIYRALRDTAGEAAVSGNLGAADYVSGRLGEALRQYERSLTLARRVRDRRTEANALGNMGSVFQRQGDFVKAAELYGRASEIRRAIGDRRGEAADLNNQGLIQQALGELDSARALFHRALSLNKQDRRDAAAATNQSNLAGVSALRGEYDEAEQLYRQALRLRRSASDRVGEAHDLAELGNLHLRWGDYPAAVRSFKQAVGLLAESGPATRLAEVRAQLAAAHSAMGQLQEALDQLDRAEAQLQENPLGITAALALHRADLYVDLNEYGSALELYRRAREHYRELSDPAGEAEAELGMALLHLTRQDFTAAHEALTRALVIQEAQVDRRPSAVTHTVLGYLHQTRGDPEAARFAYQHALETHAALGDVVGQALVSGLLADLRREAGSPRAAIAAYRRALESLDERPAPDTRWRLHTGLGLAYRALRNLDLAAGELRQAVSEIEDVSSGVGSNWLRYRYLADKWSTFTELTRTETLRGRVESAFRVSEMMRARSLLDLLARGRIARPEDELVRREETLRRRVARLAVEDDPQPVGILSGRGAATLAAVAPRRDVLERAREDYERTLAMIGAREPAHRELIAAAPAAVTEIQAALPSESVLLEYVIDDDWAVVFIVSRDGIAAVELSIDRRALRGWVEFLRGQFSRPRPASAGREPWRAPLRELYGRLIAPVEAEGHLAGRSRLLIAPHQELHYVPFPALIRSESAGEAFLIEKFEIAYVPSASAWLHLARAGAPEARGVLAMAPRPDALPASGDEVRAVAAPAPEVAMVLLGEDATEVRFRQMAPRRRILHLATNAVFNGRNPLFSYAQLRPGGGEDGRLEVHEVFRYRLSADLVFLSACETAVGSGLRADVPPGDDWVGFVRAFLSAGARSVIATLWPVDDRATAELTETFYGAFRAGDSPASALAAAQRSFIDGGRYADPYYWAAFVLSGASE